MTTKIDCHDDVLRGLEELAQADIRLGPIIEIAGDVPLRLRPGGYEGLAEIVVSQQISKVAAAAIWSRLTTLIQPLEPSVVMAFDEEDLRSCGLSRPKIRTLRAIAEAANNGFNFSELATKPPEEALEDLTRLSGVGPWTAEVYLLFCIGHGDIFPAGDVALQTAVGDALAMDKRPSAKELRSIAAHWSPWRGVAARLFWSYYAATRHDATPGNGRNVLETKDSLNA